MKYSKELIKGSTKKLILAVLSQEEMYGYQIVKTIKEQSGGSLEFAEGTIYPALHSLEKSGLLKSNWQAQENGPDRKYYALTRKGKTALVTQKKEWKSFQSAVDNVLNQSTI